MKKQLTFAALCIATIVFPTIASAGEIYNRRDSYPQQYNRNIRVENVRYTAINRSEQRDIQRQRVALEATKRRFLRDGRLTRQERQQLERMEQQLARSIRSAQRD
ncbi:MULTISPECIES: hypothetical protein [Nostocales]|uniref:P pilus assembly/Cpx signaling pathway, periplasmic inhibitor/zinc-resistance associated protein n=3 Tax=Nostocales TaxID=1161 RepID=A0A0C1RBC7_9CYAN|nr:hypothetical protein [Tolypothrix bouteillei]KAF3884423.1 hypothetical protein DA73_0400002240 [Tolypothrix bouteillei VB521301]